MDNTNNENQAEQNPTMVSPDQTSMFVEDMSGGENVVNSEEVTRMDIPHDEVLNVSQNEEPIYNLGAAPAEAKHDDEVPNSTKIKVLAALAIVGVAGYIAYWVQEPVQLKADILNGYSSTTTPTSTTNVAAISTDTSTGLSKNVDVSLFGFEPAVMKIDKGTTVIWTNTSTEDQTIIGSSEDGQSFTSPVMTSGGTFSYKFDQDATFTYYSTYNPALKATLTVGTGGTTAAATTNATATSPAATTDTTAAANTSAPATDTLFGSATASPTTTSDPAVTSADTSLSAAATDTTSATMTSYTTPSATDLKGAAPGRLAKTGPAEDMYIVILLGIAWFNRKKLVNIFK